MKNRRHRVSIHSEVDSEGSWAISYGDLVTLLLTFFIIFFSVDKFKSDKTALDINAKSAMQDKATREIASVLVANKMPNQKIMDEVKGEVYKVGKRIVVEFSGVSFFNSGEVNMTDTGAKAIKKFYAAYAPYVGQYNISIRAFTDPRKVRADNPRYQDNLELSALRSISVMRSLQKLGVPLVNMKLAGHGELKLTMQDLEKIKTAERSPSSVNDLARTTVLVIEPLEEK